MVAAHAREKGQFQIGSAQWDEPLVTRPQDEGREAGMEKSGSQKGESPSQLIDARIEELGDWRGEMLSRLRALVKEADPEVVE